MTVKKVRVKHDYVDNKKLLVEMEKFVAEYKRCKENDEPLPKPNDYIGEAIWLIAENMAKRSNFAGYCVDVETEAMTDRGFLSHDQITENDKVLSYDPTTGHMVWSKIKSIYRGQYKGKMFKLKNSKFDFLVTPGHKFVTKRGLLEVDYLTAPDKIITLGAEVLNESNDQYEDWFIRLVGWAITDGQYCKGKKKHALIVWQKVGDKSSEIESILKESKVRYRKTFHPANNFGTEMFEFYIIGPEVSFLIDEIAPNKILSYDFINSLDHRQRMLLLEATIKGDGWGWHGRDLLWGGKSAMGYVQKCEKHYDTIQYLCTLCGLKMTKVAVKQNSTFGIFEGFGGYITSSFKSRSTKVETIDFHGGKSGAGGNVAKLGKKGNPNKPTIDYDGTVWCLETEYGSFVARRNGVVALTGNSYIDEMREDAIENVLMYLHNFNSEKSKSPFSYFSKIMWWAFVRRIHREQKEHYLKMKMMINSSVMNELADMSANELVQLNVDINTLVDPEKFRVLQEKFEPKKEKVEKKKGLELFTDE